MNSHKFLDVFQTCGQIPSLNAVLSPVGLSSNAITNMYTDQYVTCRSDILGRSDAALQKMALI